MSDSKFFIIYPRGDKTKLKVLELSWACADEISEFARASREQFWDRSEAVEHAKNLARSHGLEYESDDAEDCFLD